MKKVITLIYNNELSLFKGPVPIIRKGRGMIKSPYLHLLLVVLLLVIPLTKSYTQQDLYKNIERIIIKDNTLVTVEGNLVNNDSVIVNVGTINIKRDLINAANSGSLFMNPEAGEVTVTGQVPQHINGINNPIEFHKLSVKKTDSIVLKSNITVYDTFNINTGIIGLNGNELVLKSYNNTIKGKITGENNNGYFNEEPGIIRGLLIFNNDDDIKNFGLGLDISTNENITELEVFRGHTTQTEAAVNGSISKYWDLYPDDLTISGTIKLSYIDSIDIYPTYLSDENFTLWKSFYSNAGYTKIKTTLNAPANTIESNDTYELARRWTIGSAECVSYPLINFDSETSICLHDTLILDAENVGSTYVWNTGDSTQTIAVDTAGKYEVLVTNAAGCETEDSIQVAVNPVPIITLTTDSLNCEQNKVTLNAGNPGSTYLWSTTETPNISQDRTYVVTDEGTYSVLVTNEFECVNSDSIEITSTRFDITPVFLANSKVLVNDSVYFLNLSFPEPNETYWDFGDGNTLTGQSVWYAYNAKGTYYATMTVSTGTCINMQTKEIQVFDEGELIDSLNQNPTFIFIENLMLNPNPSNEYLNLLFEFNKPVRFNVTVFDAVGSPVFTENYNNRLNYTNTFNVSSWQKGLYTIVIQYSNKKETLKVMVR